MPPKVVFSIIFCFRKSCTYSYTILCFGAFKTAGTGGLKVGPGSGDLYGMAIPTRPAGAGPPPQPNPTSELQGGGGSFRFVSSLSVLVFLYSKSDALVNRILLRGHHLINSRLKKEVIGKSIKTSTPCSNVSTILNLISNSQYNIKVMLMTITSHHLHQININLS